MTSLARASISQSDLRAKRKPAPFLDLSLAERYPPPDPTDPFAPLWVLRSRTSSAHLVQRQSIYNPLTDGRRQSDFGLQYSSYVTDFSEDDVRGVVSDSEQAYPRRSMKQNRPRQRSHSMALLTNNVASRHEFPSISSRRGKPSVRLGERSYSSTDADKFDRRPRALHVASDSSTAQKKLGQFLKAKALTTLMHSHSPRVHKASISRPVLTSTPPVMKTISLTLQASVTDPQRSTIAVPIAHDPSLRNHSSSQLPTRVASSRPPTVPVEPTSRGYVSDDPHTQARNSVSHSAFIHISYPTPSAAYPQHVHDNAYTSPRPAPRPPRRSTSLLPPINTETKPRKTSAHPQSKGNKSKPLPIAPQIARSEWALPTHEQLAHAGSLFVIAESGVRVPFGSLFAKQRTIVIFIRHFWCPLCQDYMSSVRSFANPDVLMSPSSLSPDGGSPTKLVIISNGSHAMISKYRQIFRMSFDMYTDPTLAVYSALGMGRGKQDADYPVCSANMERMLKEPTVSSKQRKDSVIGNGGYVKHGLMGGIVMVALRALKVGMPVWENGGDAAQLGGEFVFGPGLTCSFAHRMQSPKGHAPIQDVVKAALEAAPKSSAPGKTPLPAVVPCDCGARKCPAGTSEPAEAEEKDVSDGSTCSYDLVSEETHLEAREAHGERSAYMAREEAKDRKRIMALHHERRDGPVASFDHWHDEENADNASVIATCSDVDPSEGSTIQPTDSEGDTLEGGSQINTKLTHRLENTQLGQENAD